MIYWIHKESEPYKQKDGWTWTDMCGGGGGIGGG